MSRGNRRLKRRIRQSRKERLTHQGLYDTHHLLWTKRSWNYGSLKALRTHWYCRVLIPRATLHQEIHHYIGSIPLPRQTSAREALNQLGYLEKYGGISPEDSIQKRLKVLIALFDCVDECTANALQIQLDIVNRFYDKLP